MRARPTFLIEIFLLGFAALLLEVSYTRVLSFKFFYVYAYLVIGFAMLGLGSGAVCVASLASLSRVPLGRLLARSGLAGSAAVGGGYLGIARMPFDTGALFHSLAEPLKLLAVGLGLFAAFLAIGVMVAALLARRAQAIPRLYGAELLGAGLGCAAAVPLIAAIGPPASIFLAGALLALVGARLAGRRAPALCAACVAVTALLGAGAAWPRLLPTPLPDRFSKQLGADTVLEFSRWSPVFRVDVSRLPDPEDSVRVVLHDGIWSSTLHRFDGDLSKLSGFAGDPRSFPFRVLGRAPKRVAIVGSAGGREILNALYFGAEQVTAIELSPVTVSLLTETFADYTGHLDRHPGVRLVTAEARAFLARDVNRYDVIHLMAPNTYAAMNAASSAAFLLSESYLFTSEMVAESLGHLSDDGILCVQFGEWDYDGRPLRTARYLSTAREAFRRLGIRDFRRYVIVGTSPGVLGLSTVLLKNRPFTRKEVERFLEQLEAVPGSAVRYAAGRVFDAGAVREVMSQGGGPLERWFEAQPYDLRPVSDDAPFFWHFRRFRSVLAGLAEPPALLDAEEGLGERLLLLLLLLSAAFAAVCLLLPLVAIRKTWSALPRKGCSAVYFAAVGLGFMIYEICLIQKLTLFLGYPTYSLSVTLAALLVSAGLGSLATSRYARGREAALLLFAVVLAWTLLARHAPAPLTGRLLAAPLFLRVALAVIWVAPLGLALGGFLPLGLAAVSRLASGRSQAVAWAWALSGFAAVIGSLLTTILSMSFGFAAVLLIGLGAYALAVAALRGLGGARRPEAHRGAASVVHSTGTASA